MNLYFYLSLLISFQIEAEEEFIVLYFLLSRKKRGKYFRSEHWASRFTQQNLDIQFKEDLRVSREEFNYLVGLIYLESENISKAFITEALIIFLLFTTSPLTYRQLAREYGKSTTFIRSKIQLIMEILYKSHDKYIFLPTIDEFETISSNFQELSSIQGTLMCIDGTHIEITAPGVEPAKYYNYKG